ncbi:undecaprenyldiphospho-muramoylpentapeptide beta-N-acetylglucosaminyltransferase [Hydrogenovibrio halophilus]|uniref:undecaprenyldiphospho-muramoylpentapeptide beta-N-acetylglucosaminyltransferase n=1 Tax=Hydrogenovibrio halophilus TaxID=373391 RepID=UPI000376D741|nr:undecaprenyldiphospho-muramoylpentapeptide beta-N-acetylglucosaminyltransferase [Hydrogenovibrio halophilus]
MSEPRTLMIMAGGTGGHVFPGLALAEALSVNSENHVRVVWLGTEGGMEAKWVQQAGIAFYPVRIQGLRGKGLLGWLKAPWRVLKAMWQSAAVIRQTRPDLILGMGGFVCGPGGLAARLLRRPLWLHEQNAIMGLTNRWLSPLAETVICAFEQAAEGRRNAQVLGNPVRSGLEALPTVAHSQVGHVLVMGGSRGAKAINELVPQALAKLPPGQRPTVRHQTGQALLDTTRQAYQKAGVKAEVVAFIDDMVAAYRQADLVIARSGALTVSELMSAARPAILIPFPFAVDDHQTANAQALVAIGGGEVRQQADLTAEQLAERLQHWLAPEQARQASEALRASAPKQVTQAITERILTRLENTKEQR